MSRWFRTYGYAEVGKGLIAGAYPLDERDVAMLVNLRIERVLNLVEDEEYHPGAREVVADALATARIHETRLRITDYGNLAAAEIEAAVRHIIGWLDEGRRVYVHCRAGWQRSASVVAGVIAVREGLDIDAALNVLQKRKPSADPLEHQREDLRRWWETRASFPQAPPH